MNDVVLKSVEATIEPVGPEDAFPGEFKVILSTPDKDREGDEIKSDSWLLPLPDRIQFNTDHSFMVASTVGSGVPEIKDGNVEVMGTYATTDHAQDTRKLVNGKHIGYVSVAFREVKVKGDVKRELINGSFVVVPANPNAKVLSSKGIESPNDLFDQLFPMGEDGLPQGYSQKADKDPYGDVEYADPGYINDTKRYPLNTAKRVRAAWSYINMDKNAKQYSAEQLSHIKGKIKAAAKKFGIDIGGDSKSLPGFAFGIVGKDGEQRLGGGVLAPEQLVQAIHDTAYALGATCETINEATADFDGWDYDYDDMTKTLTAKIITKGGDTYTHAFDLKTLGVEDTSQQTPSVTPEQSAENVADLAKVRARRFALSGEYE